MKEATPSCFKRRRDLIYNNAILNAVSGPQKEVGHQILCPTCLSCKIPVSYLLVLPTPGVLPVDLADGDVLQAAQGVDQAAGGGHLQWWQTGGKVLKGATVQPYMSHKTFQRLCKIWGFEF